MIMILGGQVYFSVFINYILEVVFNCTKSRA